MTFRICFRVYRLATLLGPLFSWHIRACDTSNASIPLELSARTLDPMFSKSCTVSYCPLYAASWRAVEPHAHRAGSAPYFTNTATHAVCPLDAATVSGDNPWYDSASVHPSIMSRSTE